MTGGFASLPGAEDGSSGSQHQKFKGVAYISGPRWAQLPLITLGLLGVQVFWSVEMSYASPYLLSLGLSKSSMAVVFLAGPISGLIMQPLIGVLADSSTSRFGRRRPYMLLGTLLCMSGMLLLGFTRPFASLFTTKGSSANDTLTIWLAVVAIYFIDFAINAVQAMDRALLVDTLPSTKQASGNAWAARMLGVGAVVGFFVGKLNLTKAFPFLGSTQLEVLSVIVSIFLFVSHGMTSLAVKERVLLKSAPHPDSHHPGAKKQNALVREVKNIWTNLRTLPWVIRQICFIQFCSWIAWFPVLFYSSIYVGDFHKQASPPPATPDETTALDAEATRMGSRALFYSALISLACNFILPLFTLTPAGSGNGREEKGLKKLVPKWLTFHLASLWALSHLVFAVCMFGTFFTHSLVGSTVLVSITGFSWAITQWAPFALLAEAILTEPASGSGDDGESIQLEDARSAPGEREGFLAVGQSDDSDSEDEDDDVKKTQQNRSALLGNHAAHVSSVNINGHGDEETNGHHDENERDGRASGGLAAKAGIILGIHNVFIVIPQFLVTGLSSIIFAIFDPQKPIVPPPHGGQAPAPVLNGTHILVESLAANGSHAIQEMKNAMLSHMRGREVFELVTRAGTEGGAAKANSVVYVFRIGGVAATFAFVLSWRLAREMRHR